jgi:2-methylisocitrate lyase-like PEP mutase family enzyme
MAAKVRAACDARTDPDFVVIARTDALAAHGWEEAAGRARRYREAGADLVFVDGIRSVEDLRRYAEELSDLPKVYNGQLLPVAEVAALGFSVMLAGATLPVVYQALLRAFIELRERGTVTLGGPRFSFRDLTELLGLPEIKALEREYGVGEEE